ncbi:helix-turn-helix domain-containing protein [Paenibacillus paeoniae]|uniref:XRE family transcriptional regulator n=1 Tax=Paenibacillus paeoniae TaxID=2292705 RepID=A0A371PJD5_9BACL|nr:helix-turn-helix transcriptional regulator [Paenibacillus paeoniae]REK76321.1 XRE family transcriptional regulator [Paenibacillus paeoniae]
MTRIQFRLVEARKKNGLTPNQVSEATGIDMRTLSGLEKGVLRPDPEKLSKLAKLYEVSVDWLRGHINNPKTTLSEDEKAAANAITSYDLAAFLEQPFEHNGKPLNREAKKKLYVMAQLLLDQDD